MSAFLTYNWYTIWWTATNNILTKWNIDDVADSNINLQSLIWANWNIVINSQYWAKLVTITWVIFADTAGLFEAELSKFRTAFNEQWLSCLFTKDWVNYLYCNPYFKSWNYFDRQGYQVNYCNFKIQFIIPEWYFRFGTFSTNVNNITVPSDSFSVINDKEKLTEWVFNFLINSATDLTEIQASSNWKTIIIPNSTWFQAWDILIVDCVNKTVKLNWNNVLFTWFFPEIPVNSWGTTVETFYTSTSHDVSLDFSFSKRLY